MRLPLLYHLHCPRWWGAFLSPLLSIVFIAACATPNAHYRVELIDDQSRVFSGSLDANSRGITIGMGERVYNGFYVVVTESVTSTAFPTYWGRRPFGPMEAQSLVVTNQARAHLQSSDGGHLSCEFVLDGARAVGSCLAPAGQRFQFVANQ